MRATIARVGELLRRLGPAGALRHVARRLSPAGPEPQRLIWLGVDVQAADRPRRPLDEPLTLRRGGLADLALLEQLPADPEVVSMTHGVVSNRLARGAELWLVTEGDRCAFRCWLFRGSAPLQGARGRRIALPPEIVMLEDSLASPDFRGRGVAPGTWSGLADVLAEQRLGTMVTKVNADNEVTLKALAKVGFRPLATMQVAGPAWRRHIGVTIEPGEEQHAWLKAAER